MRWKHLWNDGNPKTTGFCVGMSYYHDRMRAGFYLFNHTTQEWYLIIGFEAADHTDPPIYYCQVPRFDANRSGD